VPEVGEADVAILAPSQDLESLAVAAAVKRLGAEPVVVDTRLLPEAALATFKVSNGFPLQRWFTSPGTSFSGDIRAVWKRMWLPPGPPLAAPPEDRRFASAECHEFVQTIWADFERAPLVVNRESSRLRARRKVAQLEAARKAGLKIPETIVSNDPDVIRDFVGGTTKTIYKSLTQSAIVWREDGGTLVTYAAPVTVEDLVDDDLLSSAPGIFQELVSTAYALRVTVVGRDVFAARIHWNADRVGIDWRRLPPASRRTSATKLAGALEDQLLAVMDDLGLVFGCLDLLVTPDGDAVFLEVNETGRFLFVQDATDQPILESLAGLLVSGDPAHRHSGRARFDLEAIYGEALAAGDAMGHALKAQQLVRDAKAP